MCTCVCVCVRVNVRVHVSVCVYGLAKMVERWKGDLVVYRGHAMWQEWASPSENSS